MAVGRPAQRKQEAEPGFAGLEIAQESGFVVEAGCSEAERHRMADTEVEYRALVVSEAGLLSGRRRAEAEQQAVRESLFLLDQRQSLHAASELHVRLLHLPVR